MFRISKLVSVVALLLFAAGCTEQDAPQKQAKQGGISEGGQQTGKKTPHPSDSAQDGGGGFDEEMEHPPDSRVVDVRVRGVNVPWHVVLRMDSLRVKADGQELPFKAFQRPLLLDGRDHSWLIGRFEVPEGVSRVAFEARFGSDGEVHEGGDPRPVDLSGAPVRFASASERLLARNKVVIDLDVNRSLAEDHFGAMLLPHFNIRY